MLLKTGTFIGAANSRKRGALFHASRQSYLSNSGTLEIRDLKYRPASVRPHPTMTGLGQIKNGLRLTLVGIFLPK